VHGGGGDTGGDGDSNLRVINAREVASAGRLVLLGLERERVRVHTGVGATRVMVVRLDLVEVLTLLSLEPVLTVEDKLEVGEGTGPLLTEPVSGTALTAGKEGNAGTLGDGHVAVTGSLNLGIRLKDNVGSTGVLGEVPKRGGSVRGRGVVETPHELLDWVVEREALVGGGTRGDSVRTSVLDLLNEVLVTLLRKSPTLLSVEVHVVSPHLEGGSAIVTEVGS